MTTIRIDLIRPSPHPVRTSWDEDKLNELAASIAEQGVIVPVKVRENADGFEVVYGHRRVEAARRAGLTEVPAIVGELTDEEAYAEAIIENVARDDMSNADEGRAYCRLRDAFGWSQRRIGALVGKGQAWVQRCQALVADLSISPVLETIPDANIKAQAIRSAAGDDRDLHRELANKTAREDLGREQTRRVAEAVAAASPEQREAILAEPFGGPRSTFLHDPEWVKERARDFGPRVQDLVPVQPEAVPAEARQAFAWAKDIGKGRDEIESSAKHGKLAPEHIRKLADIVRGRCKTLTTWADELEGNYGDVD